jgi:hypothetical protein
MMKIEHHIPPSCQSVINEIRKRGYIVTVRLNRNGSPRYQVAGDEREIEGHTLCSRFDRGAWPVIRASGHSRES